ncbi:peptidase domain-containing ABC transporter [Lacihabitans sp. CCS-44]|uniref:peptidase domain-containing ABC transporter n=1 Tax=Lacihabitans sp. CCS-44 TaxID=2487331 RepID=UPI0020CCE368|nr:peptidase domain-containing ABC transporter [Lacihabitans sp. CCS-44]MCP9755885.1 peptidase domain-containing ABC transporter [Lacihabitans sp. CCS-44]
MNKKFIHYRQFDQMDCGPTCLRMVAKHYGKNVNIQFLRDKCQINKEGVSLKGIGKAADSLGFRSLGVKVTFELLKEAPLPCIVHWDQNHFVVVYGIKQKGKKTNIYVANPGTENEVYTKEEFEEHWISIDEKEGIALLLETTPKFAEFESHSSLEALSFRRIGSYLVKYKALIFQLFIGLLAGTLISMILPFLTQSVVDTGIQTKNLNFIYLVFIAQLMLFLGRTGLEFIRSWLLLHISMRLNLTIISDFLIKLLSLPPSFFDTKMTGDILQRIDDHHEIESFLSSTTLSFVFNFFTFIVFGFVLAYYDLSIFTIYIVSGVLYVFWVRFFLKRRRTINQTKFTYSAQNQSKIIQMISGVQDIKLTNSEQDKRWEWENLQIKIFRLNLKNLALEQFQSSGALLINEGKNIIISFIAAREVIDGNLTLGGMMALQYIVGQLNGPIDSLVGFIQHYQDAKISLERLNEIHTLKDEEPYENSFVQNFDTEGDISIDSIEFSYPGIEKPTLKDISLNIPAGRVTAIVGSSGSGKTTLLKLLLRFYEPSSGRISVGDSNLSNILPSAWRQECGTVMQEGYIFSDSIAKNIAVGVEKIDHDRLFHAVKVANIAPFIEQLPTGYNTKIGDEGIGVSQGQKQRILIARAVYKNPSFIFFDEATNALDANNERVIMQNLNSFFRGKTVIVVAHRLSTVKNADQIIVLENGQVAEVGNHDTLIQKRGFYFSLVKNQLELG